MGRVTYRATGGGGMTLPLPAIARIMVLAEIRDSEQPGGGL